MGCVWSRFNSWCPDKMKKIKYLLISFGVTFLAAFIGSAATNPHIPIWYSSLNKPSFSPPNWIFGPVWTILYFLMASSLYIIVTEKSKKPKRTAIQLYMVQLFLNTLWSVLFFSFKNIDLAFMEILLLWVAIVITIIFFEKINKKAAYLLLPYLLWVGFASFLNLNVLLLN